MLHLLALKIGNRKLRKRGEEDGGEGWKEKSVIEQIGKLVEDHWEVGNMEPFS